MPTPFDLAPGVTVGAQLLPVISGPCVIESEERALETAQILRAMANRIGLPLIFKSSYDKANRSSIRSYRGPGLETGLEILQAVKEATGLPITLAVDPLSAVALGAGKVLSDPKLLRKIAL